MCLEGWDVIPWLLQMYDQEMTLPEQGEDIQAWVEKEISDNLSLESLSLWMN